MTRTSSVFAVSIVMALALLQGCLYSGLPPLLRGTNILAEAPARESDPEIRLAPYVPPGRPVVQMSMRVGTATGTGLPQGELMDEVKRTAAAAGATVLVFDCGAAGSIGHGECVATGYAP